MIDEIPKFRAAIDAIDDQLMTLLNERSQLVRKVGAIKKQTQAADVCYIRAGREADMVRRIVDHSRRNGFPAAAAAHMWRIIISASLTLESSLSTTVFATDANSELYWLAREYFGNFIPVMREPTARRVIGDVMDGKAQVGILPIPDDSGEGKWWQKLPEGINIFACVPFILTGNASVKAFAIARLEPEPTSEDATFVSIETDRDMSQSRLKSLLDKQHLEVRWLATDNFASGHRAHLIEIKGFLQPRDPAITALSAEAGASLLAIRVLGAYALPIQL